VVGGRRAGSQRRERERERERLSWRPPALNRAEPRPCSTDVLDFSCRLLLWPYYHSLAQALQETPCEEARHCFSDVSACSMSMA
jgi:hypothetical protein